ncbi:LiaF transmembrane domain-containing protein [Marinitoga lauensis]|uniref:LiaF transmembrane domain-containing protein n=1 Tax=Marinitoga lauensis TaxID=2201189 RepID=UPI001012EA31|nr:hypothetical protein [Marinitoga lauensis]
MRYVWGIFFIVVGIFFIIQGFNIDLLLNMGFNFLKFWPFMLIIAGISILSKNLKWLKYFNIIVTLIFLLLLFFWNSDNKYTDFLSDKPQYEEKNFEIIPNSEIINLKFDVPAVTLNISTDENSEKISGYYYGPDGLNIKYEKENLHFGNMNTLFKKEGYRIYLKIPLKYVYNFFINSGVANVNLKENINVIKKFQIDAGVSNIKGEITDFGEKIFFDIDSGVSKIDINLPDKTTYFLNYDGGIRKINIDEDLIKDDNGDFQGSIDAGVLSITLKVK